MSSSRFAVSATQEIGVDPPPPPALPPLVSVIVPAYNAEATLAETLGSIAAQTYANIEIVVVDDGSTDRTREIASLFAATDARARVVSIPNSGVAVARNTGAAHTSGPFLAPIDADDLWHPRYLETLVGLMLTAPEPPAFAYAPCRLIDPESRIIGAGPNPGCSGKVVYRMLFNNLVGNGSGMMIARTAFDATGGYDPRLHEAGHQGCEDYLLQLMLATHGPAWAAGEFLVGYRKRDGAMSRNIEGMAASRRLARQLHRHAFPHVTPPSWLGRWIRGAELTVSSRNDWTAGRRGRALRTLAHALLVDPQAVIVALCSRAGSWVRKFASRPPSPQARFLDLDPREGTRDRSAHDPSVSPSIRLQLKRLERVAALDR